MMNLSMRRTNSLIQTLTVITSLSLKIPLTSASRYLLFPFSNGTYFTRLTPITFPFLAIVKVKETGGTDSTFTELEDSVHAANVTLDFSPPNVLGDDSVGPAAKRNYLFEKVEPELHHKSSPKEPEVLQSEGHKIECALQPPIISLLMVKVGDIIPVVTGILKREPQFRKASLKGHHRCLLGFSSSQTREASSKEASAEDKTSTIARC
ncbi:hypothetical protein SASPL_156274 [Salvia splendens]|uniref:Uncharacterized protein n=1 Tax=Salvia splendens TaxID=180675 RepID=A0A8X8YY34_SALSN|nr:hypothetical protein SASPL_156274 [Salvia splendens]